MSYEPSHRKPPRQERWPNATPGEGWPAYQQGDGSQAWEPAPAWESAAVWAGRSAEPAAAFSGSRNGHAALGNGYGGAGNGYGDTWDGRGSARYGDDGHGYGSAGYAGREPWAAGNGHGGTTAYPAAGNGYGTTTAYPAAGDGYADGFDGATDGYASAGTEDYYETGNGNGNGNDGWDGYTQPGHEFSGSAGYLAEDEYPALDPAASSVLVAPDTMGEWWRQADRGRGRDLATATPASAGRSSAR